MAYDIAQIKQLITECEQNVNVIDEREQEAHAIENGSFNYAAHVPKELGEAIVAPKRISTQDAADMRAAIAWPLRFNVDIAKEGPQAEGKADDLEAFFAHCMLRMDMSGIHKARVHDHQVRSRFAPVWLSVNGFALPLRGQKESDKAYKERCDTYEQSYWRWQMEGVAPSSVGFLDRDGVPTVGTVHDELPVLQFLNEYGDKSKDPKPLDILGKQFPNLRASDGSNIERAGGAESFLKKSIKRWIIANDTNIHHVIVGPEGDDKLVEVCESFPNTFGRVPLVLFTGIYRANAEMKYRYEGLLWGLAACAKDLTMYEAIILTVAGNRRWAEPLPENLARMAMGGGDNGLPVGVNPATMTARDLVFRTPQGAPAIPKPYAPLQDVSNVLPPEFYSAYEAKKEEYEQLRAGIKAMSPAPDTVERSTAAGVLFAASANLRPYKDPMGSVKAGYESLCNMIAHDCVHGHYGEKDKPIIFSAYGEEKASKPIERGSKYEVSPSLFKPLLENQGRVRVELVAETDAQRMAEFTLELEAYGAGLSTPNKVLEAKGETDVSKALVELASWSRVKLVGPMWTNAAVQDTIKTIAIREGRNPQEIAQMMAPMLPPGAGNGGGGAGDGMPGNQTQTPAGPLPPTGGGQLG
jgi:hypothetical protein